MSKKIIRGAEARKQLMKGINAVADTVGVTLGAKGRNVIIQSEYAAPHVTKDGVTVARSISLENPVENMGAEMIKEVAAKAVNDAGDGTTTATILAQSISQQGIDAVDQGSNPMDLKRGIDKATKMVVAELEKYSNKISHDSEAIEQVAIISANGDKEIGGLIAEVMSKVSTDGAITVQESKDATTFVEVVEGVQFISGLLSPYFITNPKKMSCEIENPLILLIGGKVGNTKEIAPAIEQGLAMNRSLIIIADDFDGEVVTTLVQNKMKAGFNLIPVRAPSYAEKRKNLMEDFALLTGATIISEDSGITMDKFNPSYFGDAGEVIVDKERTTIIQGAGDKDAVEQRISDLKEQISISKHEFDDEMTRARIATLSGGVGVLYVGGDSEIEIKEKKDRIDDALSATRAAVEEGVIAGGGITLLNIYNNLKKIRISENKDEQKGFNILMKSLKSPFTLILVNSGANIWTQPKKIIKRINSILKGGRRELKPEIKALSSSYPMGYDVKQDKIVDMLKEGILDPKKVTRVALESAASIASLILTTEATITNLKEDK